MAFTVGSTLAKDSGGTAIAGGLLSADIAGGGVGPTFLFYGMVDGVAGLNKAQIDSSNRLAVLASQTGTWTARTVGNAGAVVDGVNTAAVAPANGLLGLGIFNSTEPSPTTGQSVGIQLDSKGRLREVIMDAAGNTRGVNVNVSNEAQVNASQNGTWTVQPGNTANTTPWLAKVSDGTNAAAIKAASTAAAATDPAIVVAVSPNNYDFSSGTGGSKTQRVIIDSSQLGNIGQQAMVASAPVAIASDQTVTVKGTATANGLTPSRVNAGASTNATSLKASAGNVFEIDVYNVAAYDVFLKLYNKASAPTVGTDTPVWTIPVKAGSGFSREFPMGRSFATGIAYAITKLQADADTTAVVAGDLTGSIGWI